MIPFVGVSTFISLDHSSWNVQQWEDALYGEDCFDGCPDSGITTNFVPFEGFFGFDIELQLTKKDRFAFSSLFDAETVTDTKSVSEVYVIYSRNY